MSMLRQLKEKFLNINNQTLKWVRLQDQLLQRMEELLSTIQHSGRIYLIVEESAKDNSSSIMSNDEKKEILIGLRLVRKQIKLKYYHKKQNITIVRHDFLRFDSITNDFTKLLTNYRDNLEHTDKIIKQLHSNASTNSSSPSDVINVSAKQLINSNITIKNNIITNIKDLETILSTIDQLKTKSNNNNNNNNNNSNNSVVGAESKKNMVTQNEELIIRTESNSDEEVIQNVKIVSFDPACIISSRLTISSSYNNSESLSGTIGSVVVTNAASSTTANDTANMVSATLIAIDSSSSWSSPIPINNLTSQTSSSSLILCIPPSEIVSSILLQSGFAINNSNNDNNDINIINKHSSVVSHSNHTKAPLPAVELPCGISLASLEPRVELTSNALGDVIDWTILLKSSAPEKFLKRPPVRFLFDLIRYIGDTNDGFLDSTLAFADWATVGVDKASKILFMDNVSTFSLCIDYSWLDVSVGWVNMH